MDWDELHALLASKASALKSHTIMPMRQGVIQLLQKKGKIMDILERKRKLIEQIHALPTEVASIDLELLKALEIKEQELGQAGLPANDHRPFRSIHQRAEGKTKLTVLREWLAKQPSTRKQILKGTNITADTLSGLRNDKTMFRRDGDKRWHLVKEVSRKTSAES